MTLPEAEDDDVLSDIAVGERLMVDAFGRKATYVIERFTDKTVFCERGVKFNRATGRKIGEGSTRGWGYSYARKITDADRIAMRVAKAAEKLRTFTVKPENLEAVETLLKDHP